MQKMIGYVAMLSGGILLLGYVALALWDASRPNCPPTTISVWTNAGWVCLVGAKPL